MSPDSIEWLKRRFGGTKLITSKQFVFIPEHIMDELKAELTACPEYESLRNALWCIVRNEPLRRCLTCGRLLSWRKCFVEKNVYCSAGCIDNARRIENLKSAMLEKYGVENISQMQGTKDKKRQSNLERYGVENVFQSKEIQDRQKATNIARYGVENVFQSEDVKRKSKGTCLERYGTEYANQSDEIKKKIVSTNMERYGAPVASQNETVKAKMKSTCIERYGVDNIFKNGVFIRANLDRAYDEMAGRWKDYVVPLFSKEEYTGHFHNEVYRWRCVKCGAEFESEIYNTNHAKEHGEQVPRCWKCFPRHDGFSSEEQDVFDFVKSIYGGEVICHDRNTIFPQELDIYIPNQKLAIEFDGLYWHSEEQGKDEHYHLNKTLACEKAGVRLIHIFENEWIEKQSIVKDRIKSALGIYDRRIYARKCVLKEIDSKTSNDFLEANHLQGSDHSSIRYGLYFENELVSVMTFGKPRFNKKYDFELIRFASSLGVQVIGGASKLLVHFRRGHSGSIISYANRRYSQGRIYESMGFKPVQSSNPNYFWIGKDAVFTRYQCQKHRLASLLGDGYDASKSESGNMVGNGFHRIYDCGNLVYVLV